MIQENVCVGLENGLDVGVIANLVQRACKYTCTVYLQSNGRKVNAKSIMGMMNMGVPKGGEITIICDGEDEEKAKNDIETFIKTGK